MVGLCSTSRGWRCVETGNTTRSTAGITTSSPGENHGTSSRTGTGSTLGTSVGKDAWTSSHSRTQRSTGTLLRCYTETTSVPSTPLVGSVISRRKAATLSTSSQSISTGGSGLTATRGSLPPTSPAASPSGAGAGNRGNLSQTTTPD